MSSVKLTNPTKASIYENLRNGQQFSAVYDTRPVQLSPHFLFLWCLVKLTTGRIVHMKKCKYRGSQSSQL